MQKLTPCLWFDDQAEEAVNFYTSIFKKSKIGKIARYGKEGFKDQKEADYYWNKLSAGGEKKAQQCGWLKDKYGLSWQIMPDFMAKMLGNGDREATDRVMKALLPMKKLDFAALKKAYNG